MAVLTTVLRAARAKLLSPHSWRVWLASSLRMCGASDARIQAMGRWLNPDSVKIYARMSKEEYGQWVDKLMSVRRIDTARTTSLPAMDVADALSAWSEELDIHGDTTDHWTEPPTPFKPGPSLLKPGDRVSVFWTDLDVWHEGVYTSSRIEAADGGGTQRASRIVYDPIGPWAQCKPKDLTYWHCLDDERWRHA